MGMDTPINDDARSNTRVRASGKKTTTTNTNSNCTTTNTNDFEFTKIQASMRSDTYIAAVDKRCEKVARVSILVWLILVSLSYAIAYKRNNIERLTGVEQRAPLAAAMLLGMSVISSLLPLTFRWKKGEKLSGVMIAGLVVQFVAFVTDVMLCTLPVPVFVDPFTGARVFGLRWSEWTPLAFVMTYLTEACKLDESVLTNVSTKTGPFHNMMNALASVESVSNHQHGIVEEVTPLMADNRNDNRNATSRPNISTSTSTTHNQPSLTSNLNSTTQIDIDNFNNNNINLKEIDSAFSLALCQGLSTFCGWLFPLVKNKSLWITILFISCALFLVMYYRLYRRYHSFENMRLGSSIGEQEMFHWARLSLGLLVVCTILWSILVIAFFIYSIGPLIMPEKSFLRTKGIVMVCECVIDVMFKSIYMLLILDVHNAIFDPNARAQRRLEELRQMMSVVWDNSSDVIGLSIKKPNGNVITLLSPTFLKLYSDNGNCHLGSDNNEHDSSGIAFELDAKYFLTTDDERQNDGDQKIIPSIVYQVEFSNNQFTPLSGNGGNSDGPSIRKSSNASQGELTPISELVMKAWLLKNNTKMLLHDLVRIRNNSQETIRCEANITRLEHNALVIVVRNISERFHRFEAEKKAVSETTARIKDAAANRFTRHEVKNGLLSAIGLCDSLKETQYKGKDEQGQYDDHSKRILFELDKTLHEILDTILAEAMARDVIHEVYEPKHERVNVVQLIQCTMNSTATAASMERFPVATQPSPLPDMAIDPQLLKYIHRNAVSNACKYGKRGGVVLTLVKWDEEKGILQMDVINLPGNKHEEILKLGDLAPEIIFSPSKRLPMHIINHGESASHSSGDGAWVMHKCAKTLGGDCDITFEKEQTIFTFRCPVKLFSQVMRSSSVHQKQFKLPSNMYAIAIDDSKIQRKLLARYFTYAGIPEDRVRIVGGTTSEIKGFDDWAFNFIVEHPDDYFLFIVDENLDVHDDQIATKEGTISGSLYVSKIRRKLLLDQERQILALIRSANDSADDVAIYNSRAHGYLPKAPIKPGKVLEELAPLWLARFPPIQDDFKRISSYHSIVDTYESRELGTGAQDLKESIASISCIVRDNEDYSAQWPLLWEKLHVLKGDLLTLSNEEINDLSAITKMIDVMRGPTMPHDFLTKWEILRSTIIAEL